MHSGIEIRVARPEDAEEIQIIYAPIVLNTAISFEEAVPSVEQMTHCHCSQCRKVHGAAFASYGSVPRSDLRILRGANSIST